MMSKRELVKTVEDLSILWSWKKNKKKAELVCTDPNTKEIQLIPVSPRVAEVLIEYGMNHGS